MFGFIFASTMLLVVRRRLHDRRVERAVGPRETRSAPEPLGRVFLTWFVPGPGTGYMFVVANMIAMSLVACFPYDGLIANFRVAAAPMVRTVVAGGAVTTARAPATLTTVRITRADIAETCVIATSYVIIYLGLGKLIMWGISRFGEVRLATRVLVNFLLLLMGVCVPWTIQLTSRELRSAGYTLLQITNPIWTLWECCWRGVPIVGPLLVTALPAAALVVWLLNLPALADELKTGLGAQTTAQSPKTTPNWRRGWPAQPREPAPGTEGLRPVLGIAGPKAGNLALHGRTGRRTICRQVGRRKNARCRVRPGCFRVPRLSDRLDDGDPKPIPGRC